MRTAFLTCMDHRLNGLMTAEFVGGILLEAELIKTAGEVEDPYELRAASPVSELSCRDTRMVAIPYYWMQLEFLKRMGFNVLVVAQHDSLCAREAVLFREETLDETGLRVGAIARLWANENLFRQNFPGKIIFGIIRLQLRNPKFEIIRVVA